MLSSRILQADLAVSDHVAALERADPSCGESKREMGPLFGTVEIEARARQLRGAYIAEFFRKRSSRRRARCEYLSR